MKRYSLYSIALALLIALIWVGCSTDRGPVAPSTIGVATKPAAGAIAAQNRHTDRLLAIRGVVGTAIGFAEDGSPVIRVLTEAGGVAVPTSLEEIPVEVVVTGKIIALGHSWYPRPVPIGVSTGNEGECSAGTISCRVKNGTNVYALSNNHVYALENKAPLGSNVSQPGRYDAVPQCAIISGDFIGTLADFEPIVFSTSANNTIDAAIAASSTANVGKATPSDGYGTPKSTTAAAAFNQKVKKYGRTTHLTKGFVWALNATVNVGYSSGTARFVNQIIVKGTSNGGIFIRPGDSGSLLVTEGGKNPANDRKPVGLLFAGTTSGVYGIANPIGPVLSRFGVTVDGE